MSIYRGTTPTLVFQVVDDIGQNIPMSLVDRLYITFVQDNNVVLERSDAIRSGNTATLTLTQDETLALSSGVGEYPIEIQLRGTLVGGNAFASAVILTDVNKILKDGVI